jgi:hypothetical protein
VSDDQQDWRLRADIDDARGMLGRLREASHFERVLEPLMAPDVVLSADDDTLFAYATTRTSLEQARDALRHELEQDDREAAILLSHWDDRLGEWRQIDPPPSAAQLEDERRRDAEAAAEQAREARVETRTVAITSGKMVRGWFESTVAEEARALGVELSVVEHPHLLSTQIVFTLTGPTEKVEQVIADMNARAGAATRLETAYLTPL